MNRSKLNRIWAKDSDIVRRDPGDEKYNQGWIAEIPTYQVLNFLQHKIDKTLLAIAERGIAEWGSDVEYGNGSVAWDESDKTIYIATVGKPDRSKKPSSNPEHWAPSAIQVSRLEFDKVTTAINNHIADVTSNPHKVTAGGIGAYTKAEINKIVDTYNALVASHANNKNNPHGTKAVDIGAVPVAGGKYTGEVIFEKGVFFDSEKKSSLVAVGNELNLVLEEWRLGIGSSGKPQTGKSGAMSELITEKNFADFKAKYQGDYSVPTPTIEMPLINSINLLYGVGDADYTGGNTNKPWFDTDGSLGFTTDISRSLSLSYNPILNSDTYTISIRVRFMTALTGDSSNCLKLYYGGPSLFWFKRNGKIEFWARVTSGGPLIVDAKKDSQFHTYTFVCRHNSLEVYIDGVLAGSKSTPGYLKDDSAKLTILNETKVNMQVTMRISNFKVWNTALTDKQISNI